MEDKMIRVESTITELGLALGISEDKLQITQEAALLAMSDLSTAVVTEFTSLSGVMARHYALREGYSQQVDEASLETEEEKSLWSTFLSSKSKIHPGIEVDDFVETSLQLVQPLEDFFAHVFVMVEDEKIRKNRLALLREISELPRGIADLSLLPGF